MRISVCLLFFMITCGASGQKLTRATIKSASDSVLSSAVGELIDFLALPNDGNYSEQVDKNLNWCDSTFIKLGFETKVLQTKGAPLLFAEKKHTANNKTILFYLQIDGQPVDSMAWDQPNPYETVIKQKNEGGQWETIPSKPDSLNLDWRLFARSASDSKGPAVAFITALKILEQRNIEIPYNIKVIMDFQEELGSPTLPEAVENHRALLDADAILVMDGTRHLSNLPTLTFGARGIATGTIKVFGPKKALHSGQYGNYAPNPVFGASRLVASLKDGNGRVTLPGFYDGITLGKREKEKLNAVPENLDELKKRLGIAEADAVGETYQEALQYPTLNVRGLSAAWVGKEVRTLIPNEVTIEIDMRLVPESDGEKLMQSLKQHIIKSGFHLVDSIPTDVERAHHKKLASFNYKLGSKPFRTSFDTPIASLLNNAMQRIFDDQFINMRTTGGSQPIAPFINALNADAVSVRIPNPDNNIHAPNENLRVGNFLEGIMTCLAILTEPF